jgi:hypothetical protein
MAKKKHQKKIGAHRRRRVGAKGAITDIILRVVGVGVGAVGGAFAVQAINTGATSLPAWAAPVGVAAVGVVIPHLIKGSGPMQALGQGVGDGMLAIGAVMTANQTFLSVPGISGLAMSSNAGPQSNTIRRAVAGPGGYINQTVGNMRVSSALGALVSD